MCLGLLSVQGLWSSSEGSWRLSLAVDPGVSASYLMLPECTNVACRALNQAIGRCIRHKHDYGGIILLDRRFGDVRNRKDLSCWWENILVLQGRLRIGFKMY